MRYWKIVPTTNHSIRRKIIVKKKWNAIQSWLKLKNIFGRIKQDYPINIEILLYQSKRESVYYTGESFIFKNN